MYRTPDVLHVPSVPPSKAPTKFVPYEDLALLYCFLITQFLCVTIKGVIARMTVDEWERVWIVIGKNNTVVLLSYFDRKR